MSYTRFLYLLFISAGLFTACNPTTLNQSDYMLWIESSENEAKQVFDTENLKVECLYTPSDYIVQKEIFNGILKEDMVKARKADLDNTLYFKLSFKTNKSESILAGTNVSADQKKLREEYLRIEAPKHITLIIGEDRLRPSISHFINNYGIKAETELLLGFDYKKNSNKMTLEFENQMIDTTRFSFVYELDKIPHLAQK